MSKLWKKIIIWTILSSLAFLTVFIAAIFLNFENYTHIKPLASNKLYFIDFFGNIYFDTTGRCLDLCTYRTYTQFTMVDKRSFEQILYLDTSTSPVMKVGSNFGKDKKHVYYRDTILESADPESFEAINENTGKDKDNYFSCVNTCTIVDPQSLDE